MKRVLIPLATGFEEIEAVALVDVLRRGGVQVVLAGLDGAGPVRGAHDIAVVADVALDGVDIESIDMILLPGGEPGTTRLHEDARLGRFIDGFAARGRLLGAICAAPRVLAAHGVLRDVAATSHPSVEAQVRAGGARYTGARVERQGPVVTSRGPGTAIEFALVVLEMLGAGERAAELRRGMLVAAPAGG